jgi:hypothetical protein
MRELRSQLSLIECEITVLPAHAERKAKRQATCQIPL